MRYVLVLAGVLGILAVSGCSVTAGADDGKEQGKISVVEVDLEDGYYLSDNDDSYIHITDGKIELCGYDIEGKARESYQNTDGPKVSLEEWIDNAEEIFEPLFELKEYTPVCFTEMGENGEDLILLVVDYDFASEKGAYTGYTVNSDGTISREDNVYTYAENVPEDFGIACEL